MISPRRIVGATVGATVVGAAVGAAVGTAVWTAVGAAVGATVGAAFVGREWGAAVFSSALGLFTYLAEILDEGNNVQCRAHIDIKINITM